jgi:hypothetical protein
VGDKGSSGPNTSPKTACCSMCTHAHRMFSPSQLLPYCTDRYTTSRGGKVTKSTSPQDGRNRSRALVARTCHPRYGGKLKTGGSRSRSAWVDSETPSLKQPEQKSWGCGSMVKHLPSKY